MNSIKTFNKPKIETEYVSLEIQNGILIAKFTPNIHLTLDVAKNVFETRIQYQENISLPVYIEAYGVTDSNKEARDFLAQKACHNMLASAILTSSTLDRLISNVYLHFSQPLIPTKLFSSQEEAIRWLETYK